MCCRSMSRSFFFVYLGNEVGRYGFGLALLDESYENRWSYEMGETGQDLRPKRGPTTSPVGGRPGPAGVGDVRSILRVFFKTSFRAFD